MKKGKKILLGVVILVPIVALVFFNVWVDSQVEDIRGDLSKEKQEIVVKAKAKTLYREESSQPNIDPYNDPLAPRVKQSPVQQEQKVSYAPSSEKEYDIPEYNDILIQ